MGVMDQFSGFMQRKQQERQQKPVQGQEQQQPQNQPANNGGAPKGGSVQLELNAAGGQQNNNPNNPNPNSGQSQTSPLDTFADLWQTGSTGDGGEGKPQPYISLDRKSLRERAKTLDFARTLDPQLTTKALSGDVNSFHQIINQAVQGAFALAMEGSASLAETGFGKAESRFMERIPGELKKHSVYDASLAKNPKLKHPAVQPMVAMVQSQLQNKFPDATTAEIQQMSEEYFTEFLGALNTDDPDSKKKSPQPGVLQESEEINWFEKMGMEAPTQ